jgi:hypothetical protein
MDEMLEGCPLDEFHDPDYSSKRARIPDGADDISIRVPATPFKMPLMCEDAN